MATLFRNGQLIPPAALRIIESILLRTNRPTYLGIVSLEIGWSLGQTQEMVDALVSSGVVRPAGEDEKQQCSMRSDANAYVLV